MMVISSSLKRQESWTDITWGSRSNVFEVDSISKYNFFERNRAHGGMENRWGYSIVFNKDSTFQTRYSVPCGLDCFTSVNGRYKVVNDVLVFAILSIQRSDFCSE